MKTIFKQGDTVYHWNLGQGEILEIKDELNCMSGYLRVMFDNQVNVFRFRLDGGEWNGPPVLSFKPYDLVNGGFTQERPRPDLKEGQLIYVKYPQGYWEMRYFSHWSGNGRVCCYEGQKKSGRAITWSEYSLTNPLEEK